MITLIPVGGLANRIRTIAAALAKHSAMRLSASEYALPLPSQ